MKLGLGRYWHEVDDALEMTEQADIKPCSATVEARPSLSGKKGR
jgi:hypothetical protein